MTDMVLQAGTQYSILGYADVPSFAEFEAIGHNAEWCAASIEANLNRAQLGSGCHVSRTGATAVQVSRNMVADDVFSWSMTWTPAQNTYRASLAAQVLASLNYQGGSARAFKPHRSAADVLYDVGAFLFVTPVAWGVSAAIAYEYDHLSEADGSRLIRSALPGAALQATHSSDSYLGRLFNVPNGAPTASTDKSRDGQTVLALGTRDLPTTIHEGLGLDLGAIATVAGVIGAGIVLSIVAFKVL